MATAWTPADVKAVAAEFASLSDPQIQLWCDYAALSLDVDALNARYNLAGILLTAHYLTVFPPTGSKGGAPGPIQSESVGSVSVTYSVPQITNWRDTLAATKYGREVGALIRRRTLGAQVL